MPNRVDERLELSVRHRRAVDPEAIDRGAMRRRLLGIMVVGSHTERATGNPDHVTGQIGPLGASACCLQHQRIPSTCRISSPPASAPRPYGRFFSEAFGLRWGRAINSVSSGSASATVRGRSKLVANTSGGFEASHVLRSWA